MTELALADLCPAVVDIAREAGQIILKIYNDSSYTIESKEDNTPLTTADLAAHRHIVAALKTLTPEVPVLSEEDADIPYAVRSQWDCYWLVDPLDGTREFIKRNGEFTVNIALIKSGSSVLGVINAPVLNLDYFAYQGGGAFRVELPGAPRAIHCRQLDPDNILIAGSRSHASSRLQMFLESVGPHELTSMGSSLKSCMVAEGSADIYPRLGLTSEWDTAAAQCIVEEAGGQITDTQMKRLKYNTKESLLNPEFLVFGDSSFNWAEHIPVKKR